MQPSSWFVLNGRPHGFRTLDEQWLGLEGIDFRDRTVLDLGCAEGLISLRCAELGARFVHGLSKSADEIAAGRALINGHRVTLDVLDFNAPHNWRPAVAAYDIVLALSVVHKLWEPQRFVDWIARMATDLVVIRAPAAKFTQNRLQAKDIDIPRWMNAAGWRLERQPKTCRDEWMGWFRK